ncbi:hypothetical protein SLEP1_g32545 [Rubroshorea leprosula]|uniref:Uncharacterized protein n=1 Tax=Rubroshorea leprosula TaxID=152421 RepID=A0AAV5KDM4_9ROSI|nr:hypothetical protein SLEP1_g32545 [Rubroshorea leprosula]
MRGIVNIKTLHLSSDTLYYFKETSVPIPSFHDLTNLRISYRESFGLAGLAIGFSCKMLFSRNTCFGLAHRL